MKSGALPALLFFGLLAARLCHLGILWAEEDLPMAAASQMQLGKTLYLDAWFDKPPLLPATYLLWGVREGWPLRVAGALYSWLACFIAYRFAESLWGKKEGQCAAALMAFFLIFDTPSAVTPLAADLLMLAPHLAAVYLASRSKPVWSGVLAGIAFGVNTKGIFVLAACIAWIIVWKRPVDWKNPWRVWPSGWRGRSTTGRPCVGFAGRRSWVSRISCYLGLCGTSAGWNEKLQPSVTRRATLLLLGFALTNGAILAWLWSRHALLPYYEQVWEWSLVYAGGTFLGHPFQNAILRTASWLGFHAALAIPAVWCWIKDPRASRSRWTFWLALSFLGAAAGWRFFPRYFFQILPALTLMGARGICLLARSFSGTEKLAGWAALMSLAIPLVRFGPRYAILAGDLVAGRAHAWADTAMDRDSRRAASMARSMSKPGDTLLVWGFRPELFVYTRLPAATRFLDSQALTGVPADRHLVQSGSLTPELAANNRRELIRSTPALIMDGLGPYNSTLAIAAYPDLREWLSGYDLVARSEFTLLYRRRK